MVSHGAQRCVTSDDRTAIETARQKTTDEDEDAATKVERGKVRVTVILAKAIYHRCQNVQPVCAALSWRKDEPVVVAPRYRVHYCSKVANMFFSPSSGFATAINNTLEPASHRGHVL